MIFGFYSKSDLIKKLIFIIITIYLTLKKNPNNYNYDKIYDILPKTSLNDSNKNLKDIFESRLLSYVYFIFYYFF